MKDRTLAPQDESLSGRAAFITLALALFSAVVFCCCVLATILWIRSARRGFAENGRLQRELDTVRASLSEKEQNLSPSNSDLPEDDFGESSRLKRSSRSSRRKSRRKSRSLPPNKLEKEEEEEEESATEDS